MKQISTKRIIIITGIVSSILLILAPIILTLKLDWVRLDNEPCSQIGDAIGGTTAPVIGLISILLLVWTLREQIIFNKEQRKFAFDEQFKSSLFSLLDTQSSLSNSVSGTFVTLNTNNLSEKYEKSEKTGSKVFVGKEFFEKAKYELMSVFAALESEYYRHNHNDDDLFNTLESFSQSIILGENLPPEIEHENDEIMEQIRNIKNQNYYAYVNDKYHVTENLFNKFNGFTQKQKNACGFFVFYNKYLQIGEYYRHLYHILKFIDQTEHSEIELFNSGKESTEIKDKYMEYAQLIQSQMSYDEMLFLYYDSFLFPKLKDLVIKYKLLENLYIENLIRKEHNDGTGYNLKNKKSLFQYIINNP